MRVPVIQKNMALISDRPGAHAGLSPCPEEHMMNNDVVSTSMRRDDVASTLIRRHFGTKCLLGRLAIFAYHSSVVDNSVL